MNRIADKAGSWYPAEAEALRAEVETCLQKGAAQYGRALEEGSGRPVAVVVPHAGLFYSGALAGLAFELVRKRGNRVETFVVFGACHRERLRKPAIWADGAWETPLGPVEVDAELARALIEQGVGEANPRPHEGDNAIELQLPFIKIMFPEAKIVPVAMGFFPDSWRYGELAAQVVKKRAADGVVAVASTDLTHYGASFGVTPAGAGPEALEWTRENDARFLNALTSLDLENIVPVAERDRSACGAGAAAAAAGWAKEFGCTEGRLLARTDSNEIMPQCRAEHFVGYGAVAFERRVG